MLTRHMPRPEAREAAALMLAAQMLRQPNLVRNVRRASLPQGMTFLLEAAAGDTAALADAARMTGDPPARLREAAGFFVEQILFMERADHYRVLGATKDAPIADLRHHMALLMRWIHPDTCGERSSRPMDRSVFATRITAAWETLKVVERRAAYDATLAASAAAAGRQSRTGLRRSGSRRSPGLVLRHLQDDGFLSRLFLLLRGWR